MPFKTHNKLRAEKVALGYFLFALLWILTSDYLLAALISDPALRITLGTYKGLFFVCTTALLLYIVLKLWLIDPPKHSEVDELHDNRRGLVFVFSAMALLVPLLSVAVIQIAAPQSIRTAQVNAQVVAEMKAIYLNQWFNDRRHLVDMISRDQTLANGLMAWSLDSRSAQGINLMIGYINRLQANQQFDAVYLYHLDRDQALAAGVLPHGRHELHALIEQAVDARQPVFSGITQGQQGYVMSWSVPLFPETSNAEPIAVIVLSLDPMEHLFSSFSIWPEESDSGEVFLLKPESAGGFVLISPVKDAKLALLSSVDFFKEQGLSYAGNDVIVASKPLEELDWIVVAQRGKQEVLAPVYMLAVWMAWLSLATVISVMFALRLVWVQHRRLIKFSYQMQAAEKDRLLVKFFEMPFVGMAIIDPNTGKWLQFNPELLRLMGYTEAEFRQKTWQDVSYEEHLEAEEQAYQRLLQGYVDSYTLEKQFVRKNGNRFTALLNVGAVRFPEGGLQYAVVVVQDITEQKRAQTELMQQRDLYNTLSETNQTIIRARHKDELFHEVCRIAVRYGQLHYACIVSPEDTKVKVLSSDGHLPEPLALYKAGAIVPINQDPLLESVLLTRMPRVIHHVNADASQAYFPVNLDGQVLAVLVYFADHPEFFSDTVIATLQEMSDDIAFAIRFIQQEDELRKAVQVVEASPVVLFRWENQPGWPVSYISSNISRWGYQAEEFLSGAVDFKKIVHPDDRQWLEEEVALYLSQQRQEYVQEYRLLTKDQQVIWVEDLTRVHYDGHGHILFIEGVVADVTSRKTVQQRIEFLARHDQLTSLPNRTAVITQIDTRGNDLTALLMLDLDRFKDVNDSFGHGCGDQLLCGVADLLRRECPPDALLARFGGDEFAVLLDRPLPELPAIATKLMSAFQHPIVLENGMEITISACIGMARFVQAQRNAEELLKQADTALYKAKEAGREQYCFYTSELTEAAMIRLNMEANLREAIAKQVFKVYFQPQVDVRTGKVIGAEALLRWPRGAQMIPPDEFIPIAEQSGLIDALGEWVMNQVCRLGKQWLDQGYPPIRLAVNLSSYQLRHGDVVEMIETTLVRHQYPASGLEVELTETALMRREDEAEQIFQRLRGLGVSLAIDDFGTGYSSLAYLKTFPLNLLKIDKSFIEALGSNKEDREITAAIVAMGHALGLKILAEGVETQAQLEQLKALGCDYYQGYFCSPALEQAEFEQRFMKPMASPQGLASN